MKKLLGIVTALIILIAGGGVGLQMLINQEEARQHVVHALKEQTGLDLRMEESDFQFFPWPSFHAKSVALMRPGCEPFMTAQDVHADISLVALLHREISFQDFTAHGAWISFYRPALAKEDSVREAQGEAQNGGTCSSWLPFPLQKKRNVPAGPSSQQLSGHDSGSVSQETWHTGQRVAARWKVSFDSLRLRDARILWRDETRIPANLTNPVSLVQSSEGSNGEISVKNLDLSGLRSRNPWVDVKAAYGQTDFSVRGHVGALSRLFRPTRQGEEPWLFSVGVGIGTGKMLKTLVLDGSIKEPSRLLGVQLSLQGDWPELEKTRSLGRWILPHIPWVSLSGLSGVMTLKDTYQRNKTLSEPVAVSDSAGKTNARHQFSDGLESLPHRLFPVMFHVKVQEARFSKITEGEKTPERDLVVSDALLDAAGPDLPVLMQGTLAWRCSAWFGQFRLGRLDAVIARFRQGVSPSVPVDISLQMRNGEGLTSLQSREQGAISLHLNGILGSNADRIENNQEKGAGQFSLDGKADSVALPLSCGQKGEDNPPGLHHLSFSTTLKLVNADHQAKDLLPKEQSSSLLAILAPVKTVSLSGLRLESDELGLQGMGELSFPQMGDKNTGKKAARQLGGQITITHADLDKIADILDRRLFPDTPSSASSDISDMSGSPSSGEEAKRDIATPLRDVLMRWAWTITIKGGDINYAGLVFNDLVLNSILDGAFLNNELTARWKPVSGEPVSSLPPASPVLSNLGSDHVSAGSSIDSPVSSAVPQEAEKPTIGAVLTLVPYGTDSVRFSLKSGGAGEGLFLPVSLLARPFGGSANDLHGLVQIFANLSTQGRTISDLRHSLDGTFKAVMVGGSINSAVLAPLAGPAVSLLKLGQGEAKLRCLAVSLSSHQGQVRLEDLALQAGRFVLTGQGTADLSEGLMALQLSPQVSFAGNKLAVTLAVQGPFANPTFSSIQLPSTPDTASEGDNANGQSSGLATSQEADLCASAVQKIRGDHIGLLLPAASKENHGADKLLRALGLGH